MKFEALRTQDPALWRLVTKEVARQAGTINLIPSENFVSSAVLEILGSPLTNKYSEGYPGKRYYPGNVFYDDIERLALARALGAFGLSPRAWSANVQAYSGSPANLEIYAALMKPGEPLMGMSLSAGGHLTHGHAANYSGKLYRAVQYGVSPKTGLIDYAEVLRLAKKHTPKVIVSGGTAYPRAIDFKKFGAIAKRVRAFHVADISHIAGLVIAGLHASPFPHADVVMTTTHKTLRGPRGAVIFSRRALAEKIDRSVFPGMQGGPHNNVTAAIAEAFQEARRPLFRRYQLQVLKNAKALTASLEKAGFRILTGGTDTHLLLLDAKPISMGGAEAEKLLERAGITANRNSLVGDASPFRPSGIRMGTPAVTSRGMKERDMQKIALWVSRVLIRRERPETIAREVRSHLKKYPLWY